MKVCILTHTFPRFPEDTAAPFMRGVAQGLVSAGNEVFVLTPYSPLFKLSKKEKFEIMTYEYILPESLHKLGFSETLQNDMSLKPLVYILSPLMFLFGAIALFKLVKREKIDIINAHWILPNGFIACLVSKITGTPVVSTLPGSDVYMAGKNSLFRWMAKFAAKNSAAITSNSPQLLKDLEKITEADRKKFSTIIYGVDPEKFSPSVRQMQNIRSNLKINKQQVIVLGVGRLVAKKGFYYLIKSVPEVFKKNKNVKFIIVGEGDQRQELEKLINNYHLQEKVILTGVIDYKNLVNYYNLANIFVLPSIRDEKGNLDDQSVSVMEAMACGKPIISTDFEGYKVVVSSKNGLLIKEKDYHGLANAIIKLVQSRRMRLDYGRESRKAIIKKFSIQAIGKQYSDLFKIICNKNQYYSTAIPKILNTQERLSKAKQIIDILKYNLKDLPSSNCLDIGCSSGVITNFLATQFKQVSGIDVDDYALKQAQTNFNRKNLKFLKMSGENLEYPNSSFDVVVCNQVYNFVESPQKLMNEIYRVLKKNGVCYFSARNKLFPMEPQYKLLFLSWIPKNWADLYMSLFNKGKYFYGANYLSYWGLQKLVFKFKREDQTLKIIQNPEKYKFNIKPSVQTIVKRLAPFFISLLPNYVWILRKKE